MLLESGARFHITKVCGLARVSKVWVESGADVLPDSWVRFHTTQVQWLYQLYLSLLFRPSVRYC